MGRKARYLEMRVASPNTVFVVRYAHPNWLTLISQTPIPLSEIPNPVFEKKKYIIL